MPVANESISRAAVIYDLLSPACKKAIDKIEKLESRHSSIWRVDRQPVFEGVAKRIEDPGLIRQGTAGLCGPASALYAFASQDPEAYATYVIDLYHFGKAMFGTLLVKPCEELKDSPIPAGVAAADWIPLASIRNSQNKAFEYISDRNAFAGMTLPHEMVAWYKSLGYTDVVEKTHLAKLGRSTLALAEEASRLYSAGYQVSLFVNADGARSEVIRKRRGSLVPNHWVTLTSPIHLSPDNVYFSVFSWGSGEYIVPQPFNPGEPGEPVEPRCLTLKKFLKNFYGFVAARF